MKHSLVIDFSLSFHALQQMVQEHNAFASPVNRVKGSALLTARELIRLYGVSLTVPANLRNPSLPLSTNNKQLASLTQLSARTIQRHMDLLLRVGIVLEKHLLSRKTGYLIWMHPALLLKSDRSSVYTDIFSFKDKFNPITDNKAFTNFIRTSCRQSYGINNSNKLLIGDVHIVDNNKKSGYLTGNTEKEDAIRPASGDAFDSHVDRYVNDFWQQARKLLYRDVDLYGNQVEGTKKLLRKWYAPVPADKLSVVHKNYLFRLKLVRQYLDRKPDERFVPLPSIYFDPENATGFTATKAWRKNFLKDLQDKKLIQKQIDRYRENPSPQVFYSCQRQIEHMKGKYQHLFYKAVERENV